MSAFTVLVTGGNGFLGQHVVKLLQDVEWVTAIRILDLEPFIKQLDYNVRKPIESLQGSVTDRAILDMATKGADCVIHLAGLISVSFSDNKILQSINVGGTQALLDACVKHDVGYFLYCSSQTVVVGYDDIINGTEELQTPPKFLFGKYAQTKHQAEKMVKGRNNSLLSNGKRLLTLILRPIPMYGELDHHYISNVLQKTKRAGGTLTRFGDPTCVNQFAYVGNVAWAFVCALSSLICNSDLGGEAFLVSDDTPITNMFDHCKPFVESHGMKVSSFSIPICFMYILVAIWTLLLRIASIFVRVNTQFTYCGIRSINMNISVTYSKAARLLSYRPLFNADECHKRSLEYYRNLALK